MKLVDPVGRRSFLRLLGGAAVVVGGRSVSACAPAAADAANSEQATTEEQYDYIIVGSGAGGGPLAANLARQGFDVLLLEAGEDRGATPAYQVPAWNAIASEDPTMRWDYFVRHYDDDAQQALDPKATPQGVYYPRGGTLGGCTAVNALITVYPHASDWQHIADLTGDTSWSPDNMRPYYERMERCDYLPAGTPGHGTDGWLKVNKASALVPDKKLMALVGAASEALLLTNPAKTNITQDAMTSTQKLLAAVSQDLNSAAADRDTTEGVFTVPLAMDTGARNGPREYVLKTKRKYKLTIKTRALAAKVVFENGADGTPVAVGIDYLDGTGMDPTTWKNTAKYRADRDAPPDPQPLPATKRASLKKADDGTVKGEVILSCGVFNTPQLLKLSGIGPASELGALGINVVVDLPGVGKNLQDRYEISVVNEFDSDFDILNACTFGGSSDFCFQIWQAARVQGKPGGVYSSGPVAAVVARSSPQAQNPDLVIFGIPGDFRGYKPGYSQDVETDHRHFTWAVLKAHTNNTAGSVTLKSADPRDTPDIHFRYFQEGGDADLAAVVKGVMLARGIAQAVPAMLQSLGDTSTATEVVPGPDVQTPEQIGDFVKREAWGHHASCTCPIGPREAGGVLDSRFRVYGTKGLRVVDASVFPKTPGFFIAVPIYMVSEKAFDVIVADAGQTPNLGPL